MKVKRHSLSHLDPNSWESAGESKCLLNNKISFVNDFKEERLEIVKFSKKRRTSTQET